MHQQYGSTSAGNGNHHPRANGSSKPASADVLRTKILLLGARRSGKTSIREVIFNDCSPKDTLYIELTTRITKCTYDTVIPLEIWDCPGDMTLEAVDAPLSQFATIIFVLDIQDLYPPPITRLVNNVIAAYKENPNLNLEVFVHKADTLSEEYRIESFSDLQQRILDELTDISIDYDQIPINFQLTSIHDYTLHDAFSRTLQKSIESLPFLEDLLNVFYHNSQSSKAFLFDIKSRLYVATDASPVDPPTHRLCNDYLLMLNSFGPLYRSVTASPKRHRPPSPPTPPPVNDSPSTSTVSLPPAVSRSAGSFLSASRSPLLSAIRPPSITSAPAPAPAQPSGTDNAGPIRNGTARHPAQALFYPSASAALAPSSAGAGAGTTITYHLITRQLALLALIPNSVYETRRGLVEYNVVFFREGVQEICAVEEEARRGGG